MLQLKVRQKVRFNIMDGAIQLEGLHTGLVHDKKISVRLVNHYLICSHLHSHTNGSERIYTEVGLRGHNGNFNQGASLFLLLE